MKIQKRIRLQTREPDRVRIVLVGCGGTGSFLALHLARLAWHAWQSHGRAIALEFVDPDHVERQNLGRQNFAPAEVGQPKAEALARRYALAFGLDIAYRVAPFGVDWTSSAYDLSIIVGAVDNNAARRDIHEMCTTRQPYGGTLWWLDCGNHEHSGQVLLGNSRKAAPEITPLGVCAALPLPTVQHPELLVAEPPRPVVESCAELTLRDAQSLMINQMVASHAAAMLARLLISRDLDYYASYFDLTSGAARSLPITKESAE